MPVDDYFGECYSAARAKFLAAAAARGASTHTRWLSDYAGPRGERLGLDVVRLGASEASTVAMVLSGVHGVEGFAGSGCQVGLLLDGLHEALPGQAAAVLVHAVNPYGFAWSRRVNEDGVDLNRNWIDFDRPPSSTAYEALHRWLVPDDVDGPAWSAAGVQLERAMQRDGGDAFQAAVSGGQYTRPAGLFYGGVAPAWSARALSEIVCEHVLPGARRVVVLDLHTGLGPFGYGQPMTVGGDAGASEWVRAALGPEVVRVGRQAASAEVHGSLAAGLQRLRPAAQWCYVALEFGTRPFAVVLDALRADHVVHAQPAQTAVMLEIAAGRMRDAFFPPSAAWRAAVYGRLADLWLRLSRHLGQPD